jgi:hypothetical protein
MKAKEFHGALEKMQKKNLVKKKTNQRIKKNLIIQTRREIFLLIYEM